MIDPPPPKKRRKGLVIVLVILGIMAIIGIAVGLSQNGGGCSSGPVTYVTPTPGSAYVPATYTPSTPSPEVYAPGPVAPSTLFGDYYGWVWFYGVSGEFADTDYRVDSTAVFATESSTQKPFFECYSDDMDHALASMYVNYSGGLRFTPDIGDQDAWVCNVYLTEASLDDLDVSVSADGKISMTYTYYDQADPSNCMIIMMRYRQVGQYWDVENEVVPPGYETYLANDVTGG